LDSLGKQLVNMNGTQRQLTVHSDDWQSGTTKMAGTTYELQYSHDVPGRINKLGFQVAVWNVISTQEAE